MSKFDDALRDVAAKLATHDVLRVGFLEGAAYPDGTSVPLVAAIQEFGAPAKGIPPRPFFRNMIAAKSGGWGKALGKILLSNGGDGKAALATMGEGIRGQLKQSITELTDPPLAESTIEQKGFAKPLIDTSHMLNSVAYEVSNGNQD